MILDNLNDSALYEGINPLFKQAFDYIKSLDLATVELGKTVLVDDELIVMVNSTGLKSPDKARMEVHKMLSSTSTFPFPPWNALPGSTEVPWKRNPNPSTMKTMPSILKMLRRLTSMSSPENL